PTKNWGASFTTQDFVAHTASRQLSQGSAVHSLLRVPRELNGGWKPPISHRHSLDQPRSFPHPTAEIARPRHLRTRVSVPHNTRPQCRRQSKKRTTHKGNTSN